MRSAGLSAVGWIIALGGLEAAVSPGLAQQATVATPFHSTNQGFYEYTGTSWALRGNGWNASFGAPNMGAPQFGGYQPGSGANLGFGISGPGLSGQFSGTFAQGSRQSLVSQTPSVTLSNGAPGMVADTSVSPFVMGYIPVVGAYPMAGAYPGIGWYTPSVAQPYWSVPTGTFNPAGRTAAQQGVQGMARQNGQRPAAENVAAAHLEPPAAGQRPRAERADNLEPAPPMDSAAQDRQRPADRLSEAQASSAGRAVPSVAEARRLRAAEQGSSNGEAAKFVEMARNAEAAGKPGLARMYYQMAARRASGDLKEHIIARLAELPGPSSAGR